MQPQFPLYIPSKGRAEYMMTSRALTKMGVRHFIVVEPQQMDEYRAAVKRDGVLTEVLELDLSYKNRYELCDDLGLSKSTGPGPARNFAWDHAIATGHGWHWVMDDNIREFYRLNHNLKIRCYTGAFWRAMEDFALRYKNVAMAGPNYDMFIPRKVDVPPFITNTRIYSCNLIRNDVPFRWRGRYNEDTIMSLDMLKAGWCTVQFNAFLQKKERTQMMKGGNTTEFYHAEGTVQKGKEYADNGTLAKSQMVVKVHPDIAEMVWKFKRWHHHVNYKPFQVNRLLRRPDLVVSKTPNEYGMTMVKRAKQGADDGRRA